jgi:hypothetical protein
LRRSITVLDSEAIPCGFEAPLINKEGFAEKGARRPTIKKGLIIEFTVSNRNAKSRRKKLLKFPSPHRPEIQGYQGECRLGAQLV